MSTAFRPARWVLAGVAAVSFVPTAMADAPQRSETADKPAIVLARARAAAAKVRAEDPATVREADPAVAAALENIAEDNRSELEMRLIDHKSEIIAAGN